MLLLALLVAPRSRSRRHRPGGGVALAPPRRGAHAVPPRGRARFAPGQHRGIDIAAAAGRGVRSACHGRVRFAGRLPGRGRVVSVVCGRLVATYLELGSLAVRRGDAVAAGAPIGTVAASHLQLGARRDRRAPNALRRPPHPPRATRRHRRSARPRARSDPREAPAPPAAVAPAASRRRAAGAERGPAAPGARPARRVDRPRAARRGHAARRAPHRRRRVRDARARGRR